MKTNLLKKLFLTQRHRIHSTRTNINIKANIARSSSVIGQVEKTILLVKKVGIMAISNNG